MQSAGHGRPAALRDLSLQRGLQYPAARVGVVDENIAAALLAQRAHREEVQQGVQRAARHVQAPPSPP